MRPTTSARSIANLTRSSRKSSTPSIPSRLVHSSPRLGSEAIAQDSSLSSASSSSFPIDPSSSSSSPTPAWPRPLPEGKVAAYDLALEFLRSREVELDAKRKDSQYQNMSKDPFAKPFLQGADKRSLAIHDPEVRWNWEQGLADPELPSSLYFEREKFELGGTLDLHEDRINHSSLVPDVALVERLLVDFAFKFPVPPPLPPPQPDQYGWVKEVRPYHTRDLKDGNRILCGARLTVKETLPQPELEIRHFGYDQASNSGTTPDQRYTLLMLDPDVPDPATYGFTQKIHWMVPNINLTPSTRVFPSPDMPLSSNAKHVSSLPDAIIPYLPPHPHKGSDVHRYTFLLLRHVGDITFGKQDVTGTERGTGVVAVPKRDGFNYRAWVEKLNERRDVLGKIHNKRPERVQVVGMSFFRSVYDEVVCPQIWKELICKPEVKFVVKNSSNRLYLDRWGVNKADAVQKKKLFQERVERTALLPAQEADKVHATRHRARLAAGLSEDEADQMQREEETGKWVGTSAFAQEDSTVAKGEGLEGVVLEVKKTNKVGHRQGYAIPPKTREELLDVLRAQMTYPEGPTRAPKAPRYEQLVKKEEEEGKEGGKKE